MGQRVLIVEDDVETADFLAKALRQDGFTVEHVADGRDGLIMGSDASFDLIVMDRMLPTMDGLSVVKALRAAGIETPILILSAVSHIDERVKGLRAGGDDYITKPFGYSEVAARIDNLLRRRPGKEVETELACGDLQVDLLSRRATRAGQAIDLLPREFKLLEYLLRHKDHVVTRTMLLEQVWDYRFDPHTSVIDTHVSRLRKKIDDGFATPLLHTIRGAGYRLSERP
jgi:two-component system OmpR family response regulator